MWHWFSSITMATSLTSQPPPLLLQKARDCIDITGLWVQTCTNWCFCFFLWYPGGANIFSHLSFFFTSAPSGLVVHFSHLLLPTPLISSYPSFFPPIPLTHILFSQPPPTPPLPSILTFPSPGLPPSLLTFFLHLWDSCLLSFSVFVFIVAPPFLTLPLTYWIWISA